MLVGVCLACEVSAGKEGWCLYALWSFNKKGRKLDGCRNKADRPGKLDDARLLSKMAKCQISETYVNIDGTQP